MFLLEIDKVITGSDIEHSKTSWQISLTPDFNSNNIVFESLEDENNLTSINIPLPLTSNDLYYGRIKIHFSDGSSSDWGKPIVITKDNDGFTFNDTIIVTPSLNVDFDIRNTPLGGFNINCSDFKLFSGVGKHKYSNWIIEDNNGNQIWSRINDTYNLTSIRIPNNILMPGKIYTIKVMYVSDTNAYSNYGKLTIVTKADLIRDPTYLNKLGITDLKAFETNASLRNLLYDALNIDDLMKQLVKSNIAIGILEKRLKECNK